MFSPWPGWFFARKYALRATALWTLVHLIVAFATSGQTLALPPAVLVVFLPLVGIVGILDSRRRGEMYFLQNLGRAPGTVAACWTATGVLLELGLCVARPVFA